MAQYIDREALIAEIEENINTYWNDGGGGYYLAEDALNYSVKTAPAADVVPRAEVALEVIGEVEKMARDYIDGIMLLDPQNTYCFGGINAFENVIKFLAELKKKYTGEV